MQKLLSFFKGFKINFYLKINNVEELILIEILRIQN